MGGTSRLSRSRVDQAGERLRGHKTEPLDPFSLRAEFEIVSRFRSEWAEPPRPLVKVIMGVTSMASTAQVSAKISQRLKRVPRIVNKLTRYPKSRLTQMQDIGGCRALVSGLTELMRLHERIAAVWAADIVRTDDYLANPKPSGYRAIHVVVRRDDHLVEVQLRTSLQHAWATAVEQTEARLGQLFREDEAGEVADRLRDLAEVFALLDRGEGPSEALLQRVGIPLRLERPGG